MRSAYMSHLTVNNDNEHEKILKIFDANSGLNAIIAIHSTHLGPAVGCILMSKKPMR